MRIRIKRQNVFSALHFDTVYTFDSKMLIKLFTNNIDSSKSIFIIVVGKFISLYLLTHPYIKSRFCETFVLYMNQYFIIYKPHRVASQFSPIENKETLANYFDVPKDVYPVGRLDADSEGLLILTNDTTLNHKLLHPSFEHQRTYYAQVDGAITKEAVQFPTLRLIRYSIGKLSIANMQPGDMIEMGHKEMLYQIL